MKRALIVYGTRPEAIKMAPIVQALAANEHITPIVAVTGQHREMLDQVNQLFDITPEYDADIFAHGQSLTDISARTLTAVTQIIDESSPDVVVVQGDTTTSTFAGLAAFYRQLPVVHIEAGLRTGDIYSPFPEEVNRKITTQVASLHLAPTSRSRDNLLRENVSADEVVVTGNTVIDALLATVERTQGFENPEMQAWHDSLATDAPVVLVTSHRRENLGEGMDSIGAALREIATQNPDVQIVFPIHRNPAVRATFAPHFEGIPNIHVCEPLSYSDFAYLMAQSSLVVSDSGGVQEEAPSLGKVVLVMRDTTERPEAIHTGAIRLIGTQTQRIVEEVTAELARLGSTDLQERPASPYGDGRAAERTVAAIEHFFGLRSERMPDFGLKID